MMPPEEYQAALQQQAQAQQQEKVMQQQYEQSQFLRNKQHQQPAPGLMGGLGSGGMGAALGAFNTSMDNAKGFRDSKRLEKAMAGMGQEMNAGALKKAMGDYENMLHNQKMDRQKLKLQEERNQIARLKAARERAEGNQVGPDGKYTKLNNTRNLAPGKMGELRDTIRLRDNMKDLIDTWDPKYGNAGDIIPGKKANEWANALSQGQTVQFFNKLINSKEVESWDQDRKESLLWWSKMYKFYINPEIKSTSGAAVSAHEQARNDLGNLLNPSQAPELTSQKMVDIFGKMDQYALGHFSDLWDMKGSGNTSGLMQFGKRRFGEDVFKDTGDPNVGMLPDTEWRSGRYESDDSGNLYKFGKFNPKKYMTDPAALEQWGTFSPAKRHEIAKKQGWLE